ncbi:Retrovirus-related Pol polyprotein from transposon 17.6, partial [Dictyocoela muelleri]
MKSESKYCSCAFYIPKKDKTLRLVVDYSNINKHTAKEVFPCPNLHECLTELSSSKIFSSIDLNMGYHQILMSPESRKYTSFVLLNDQYEFIRMPFGLLNAPRTFKRAMKNILGDLKFVKIYLDDVLIHSKDIDNHHIHIREVVNRLSIYGMTINIRKCEFFKTKIEYLEHFITPSGYYPNTQKVEIYKNQILPRTRKQLQRLIGIINWFRPLLSNISIKILFLTDKLKNKQTHFKWNNNDLVKLRAVWNEIEKAPFLNYPDFSKKFFIEVDASERGIGGVIYQDHGILGFYSYKLSESELNYSVVEKESYAIYKMIIKYKTLLFNGQLIVRTDNRNILFKPKESSSKIHRWLEVLNEFSITYEF